MRSIYTQFSGLAGLLAFLNQLWSYAPIESSVLIGFGTGIVVYLLLIVGDLAIHRILAQTPAKLAEKSASRSPLKSASTKEKEGQSKDQPDNITKKAA